MEQITKKYVCRMATFNYNYFTHVCDYCNVKKKSGFLFIKCEHSYLNVNEKEPPSHHCFLDFCEKCCYHYGFVKKQLTLYNAFKIAKQEHDNERNGPQNM